MVRAKNKGLSEAETQNLESMIRSWRQAQRTRPTSKRRPPAIRLLALKARKSWRAVQTVIGTSKPLHKVKKGQSFKIRSASLHGGA